MLIVIYAYYDICLFIQFSIIPLAVLTDDYI